MATINVNSLAQLNTAFNTTAVSGDTIVVAAGTYLAPTFANKTFSPPVTIVGADINNRPLFSGRTSFINAKGVTLRGMECYSTTVADARVIWLENRADVWIDDCIVHGIARDPAGNWASGSYTNIDKGIGSVDAGGSAFNIEGIKVTKCKIYDVGEGIVVFVRGPTGFEWTDNEIYNTYSDKMKVVVEAAAIGPTVKKIVQRNVCYNTVGNPYNADNPHMDIFQFVSYTENFGLRVENFVFEQNVAWMDIAVSGRYQAGLFFANDGGGSIILKNPTIRNNYFILEGNNTLSLNAVDGGVIEGNVGAFPATTWPQTPATSQVNIIVTSVGPGTLTVQNNVFDAVSVTGSNFNSTGNVVLGYKGATIAYTAAFDGPTFSPTSLAEVVAKYAPKAGGPGVGKIGVAAVGSVRNPVGWTSYDGSVGGGGGSPPVANITTAGRLIQSRRIRQRRL